MKNVWYGIAMFVLIGVIGFCGKETVRGQEQMGLAAKEQFYREQERSLMEDTEKLLTKMGYCHCGITLNRIVSAEKQRTYTFTIHHKKIDRMNEEERGNLETQLRLLTKEFLCAEDGDCCEFCYRFLVLQQ